jgi:hypothetical protein
MSDYFTVRARRDHMDQKRAKRIEATLERCGISLKEWPQLRQGDRTTAGAAGEHLLWGLVAKIRDASHEIYLVVEGLDNAKVLASELRCCGMVVGRAPYERDD